MSDSHNTSYYAVLAFTKKGARLVADPPRIATSEANAKRMAERLAPTRAGVIAISRSGDDEFGEPIILAEHGTVPSADGF